MRPEAHLSVARAEVRDVRIRRHDAARFDGGHTFALSSGIGMPRMWSFATTAVLRGFEKSLDQSSRTGKERLEDGADGAQKELTRCCDALVEKMLPDATLVAVLLDPAELHVLAVGPGRVYLHRRGQPQRLTPREETPEGVLDGTPSQCTTTIEPGDVVLAGSVSAFSVRAIGRLASVLDADASTPTSVLASLLTEPAARAGVGAAALALRVR